MKQTSKIPTVSKQLKSKQCMPMLGKDHHIPSNSSSTNATWSNSVSVLSQQVKDEQR